MSTRYNKYYPYLLALVLTTSGCGYLPIQTNDQNTASSGSTDSAVSDTNNKETPQETVAIQTPARKQPVYRQPQILELGSGNYVAQPNSTSSEIIQTEDGEITLNFQDTDVREFIKVVLGDLIGVNYLIDPQVSGKVTIETPRPINEKDLMPLLEELLAMNGAAIVSSAGIYKIVPSNKAIAGNITPTRVEDSNGYGVNLIPLRYVSAQEMQKILEPFLANAGNLRIDPKRNLVIVSGTQKELVQINDIINIFDVDWMRGMSMGLYPLDYVDPKTLKTELDSVLGAIEGETSTDLGGLIRTVAIERLNSILLISSTPAALREVEIWLHRLDRPGQHVGKRLYVYRVQNAKATDLGDILGNIFSDTGQANTTAADAQLAPGLTPTDIGNNQQPDAQTSSPAVASDGTALPSAADIKIIADDVRNALVIMATPEDYKMVEAAIKQLDIVPLQVLIEASILEVTLRDDLSYGVEWFFKNSFDGGTKSGRGTLDFGNNGVVSTLFPGFGFTVTDQTDQVRMAINALENESEVNVLSSPSLMVLDNQTATINVGDEIPVPSRQSISNLDPSAPTVNEIEFRQTGVTLTVTPRVNSGGLVTMEIKQEVSTAVDTTTSDIDAPTIQNRLIESVVAVNSGETIVLGGLIQDTSTSSEGGIPLLHRIPFLGKLFGATSSENLKTELLVLITPRVIGDRDDARKITDEFRKKLRGLPPIQATPSASSKEPS